MIANVRRFSISFLKSLTVYPPNQLHTVPHFILKTMYLQVLLDRSDHDLICGYSGLTLYNIFDLRPLGIGSSPILRTTSQPSSFILTTTSVNPFCLQHHFCIGLFLRNIRQCNHFIDRIFLFGLIKESLSMIACRGFFIFWSAPVPG